MQYDMSIFKARCSYLMIRGHIAAYGSTAEAWGAGRVIQQRQLNVTRTPALLPSAFGGKGEPLLLALQGLQPSRTTVFNSRNTSWCFCSCRMLSDLSACIAVMHVSCGRRQVKATGQQGG